MTETARPPLPRFPGGPDPSKPVPRDPVEGVDLARYVTISAELTERKTPRKQVLARAQLDEMRWMKIEQTWLLRIATAALQGDLSLLQQHDAALFAAKKG